MSLISIILLALISNAYLTTIETKPPKLLDYNITTSIQDYLKFRLEKFISVLDPQLIEKQCIQTLQDIHDNDDYFGKLLMDSSRNMNDMGSYTDCVNLVYDENLDYDQAIEFLRNIDFLIIEFKPDSTEYDSLDIRKASDNFIYGFCVKKGCSISNITSILNLTNVREFFSIVNSSVIKANYMSEVNIKIDAFFILSIILNIFVVIFILFTCFPKLPAFLFKCCPCFKLNNIDSMIDSINSHSESLLLAENKKMERKNSHIMNLKELSNNVSGVLVGKYNERLLNKFSECFDIIQNVEADYKVNNSGIAFTTGLLAISMILYSLAIVNYGLFTSSLKLYCPTAYKNMLLSYEYVFIILGQRHSVSMIFALCGFFLTYKSLCYFDKELENITVESYPELARDSLTKNVNKHKEMIPENENQQDKDMRIEPNQPGQLKNNENEICLKKQSSQQIKDKNEFTLSYIDTPPSLLSVEKLRRLIFNQIYRYVLLVLFSLLFKISIFQLLSLIFIHTPSWINLYNYVFKRFNWFGVLKTILLLDNIIPRGMDSCSTFWIGINDMCFFLITSLIIYLSYKYSYRLDKILIYLTIVFVLLKIAFMTVFILAGVDFNTTVLLGGYQNSYIYFNPIYQYSNYLIGAFFGLVNYSIQKVTSCSDIRYKPFVTIPLKLVNLMKKLRGSIVILIFLLINGFIITDCLLFKFIHEGYYGKEEDPYLTKTFKNIPLNFVCLLDGEVSVFLLLFIILTIYLKGDVFIIKLLSIKMWGFISNSFLIFSLLSYPILSVNLYQSDSRFKVSFRDILFLSTYLIIILVLMNFLMTAVFVKSLKRVNRLFVDYIYDSNKGIDSADSSQNK